MVTESSSGHFWYRYSTVMVSWWYGRYSPQAVITTSGPGRSGSCRCIRQEDTAQPQRGREPPSRSGPGPRRHRAAGRCMTASTLYRVGEAIDPGSACVLCQDIPFRPVNDHCHRHGWVRGVVCRRCNALMTSIDRRVSPQPVAMVSPLTLAGLVAHAAKCPARLDQSPTTLYMTPSTDSGTTREPGGSRRPQKASPNSA